MSKVPLSEQIEAVESVCTYLATASGNEPVSPGLASALATLKLFARYESEVRDLLSLCIKRDEQLPGARIEVANE